MFIFFLFVTIKCMRELLPALTGAPKKKRKQTTTAIPDESLSVVTDVTPGTPNSSMNTSSDGMCETPCSSSGTEDTPNVFSAILQASQTGSALQIDSASCRTCEHYKNKRRALLKTHNRLKKKYAALKEKFSELQEQKVCSSFLVTLVNQFQSLGCSRKYVSTVLNMSVLSKIHTKHFKGIFCEQMPFCNA